MIKKSLRKKAELKAINTKINILKGIKNGDKKHMLKGKLLNLMLLKI